MNFSKKDIFEKKFLDVSFLDTHTNPALTNPNKCHDTHLNLIQNQPQIYMPDFHQNYQISQLLFILIPDVLNENKAKNTNLTCTHPNSTHFNPTHPNREHNKLGYTCPISNNHVQHPSILMFLNTIYAIPNKPNVTHPNPTHTNPVQIYLPDYYQCYKSLNYYLFSFRIL